MMKHRPLSRRTLLKGAGGVTIALPFLEAMLPIHASAAPNVAKRFVSIFSGCGQVPDTFFAKGTETDFTLSPVLKPLAAYRDRLLLFDGITNDSSLNPQFGGHQGSHASMISGRPFTIKEDEVGDVFEKMRPGGPSLDQVIAEKLAKTSNNKFQSIQLGVMNGDVPNKFHQVASFTSQTGLLPAQKNPSLVFDMLFKDAVLGGSDASAAELLKLRRKSVLDSVAERYAALNAKLGASDKARVDQHLTSIREIEKQLLNSNTSSSCKIPNRPLATLSSSGDLRAYAKAQWDLMAIALACDLTRVASLVWFGTGGGNYTYDQIDSNLKLNHHDLSHLADPAALTTINGFIAENVGYLMTALDRYKDANGGSLLDSTMILWWNELGTGDSHRPDPSPFVLAGGAAGRVKMGRFLSFTKKQSNNNLLLSIYNAVTDSEDTTFGDPKYCTGPLPGFA
jgi:hypothetical protein